MDRTLAKMHLRHLNGWINSEKKRRIPLKIESGCPKTKVYSNGREKLELVPRPPIAPQKPPRTGHVSDFVHFGRSLRLEEGSVRLFSEASYSLLPDKYRFQEVFAMIQVLLGLLVAAVQLDVGEGWKSGLHTWTHRAS